MFGNDYPRRIRAARYWHDHHGASAIYNRRWHAAGDGGITVPDDQFGVGFPYPLVIGPLASSGVMVGGRALVRMGDNIPTPPGIMTILGPPAAPFINDQWPP